MYANFKNREPRARCTVWAALSACYTSSISRGGSQRWLDRSISQSVEKWWVESHLQGLGLKRSGNKKELVDRILGREVVTEKNKKKPKWRNSKARAMLVRMLMDKESSVLQEYDLKSFQRYVRDLRKANPQKVAVITEDNNIIKGELERFPSRGAFLGQSSSQTSFARRCQSR